MLQTVPIVALLLAGADPVSLSPVSMGEAAAKAVATADPATPVGLSHLLLLHSFYPDAFPWHL